MRGGRLKDGGRMFDVGLEVLCICAKGGQCFSHQAIADVCGVSRTLVFLIEKKALRKIREKLRREMGISVGGFYGANKEEAR